MRGKVLAIRVSTEIRDDRGALNKISLHTATYWRSIILGMVIIDRLVIYFGHLEVDLLDTRRF